MTYLNNPISEDPDNLDKIIEVIGDFEKNQFVYLYPEWSDDPMVVMERSEVRPNDFLPTHGLVVKHVKRLLRSDYHTSMIENTMVRAGQSKEIPRHDAMWHSIAYKAVWDEDTHDCGWAYPACGEKKTASSVGKKGLPHLFVSIIDGGDLGCLKGLLQNSNECTKTALVVVKDPDGTFFKDRLEQVKYFSPPTWIYGAESPGVNVFNHFIDSIMGFSLCWFLFEPPKARQKECDGQPNRFRLRQCSHCNNFYIADRLPVDMSLPPKTQTFCSKKCKSDYHNAMLDREKLNGYRREQYSNGNESYFPKP